MEYPNVGMCRDYVVQTQKGIEKVKETQTGRGRNKIEKKV